MVTKKKRKKKLALAMWPFIDATYQSERRSGSFIITARERVAVCAAVRQETWQEWCVFLLSPPVRRESVEEIRI